jgi:acyl-CoA thioester hydrolase
MPYIHTRTFRVRHYECDAHGRLQPAAYLGYMQEAAFDGSAAVGYSEARYREIGYYWLAYETDIEWFQSLGYGDSVEIKTWVMDFRRVRSLRAYEFYHAGEKIAQATTDWVLLDTRTLMPAAIPQEIITAYAQSAAACAAAPDCAACFPTARCFSSSTARGMARHRPGGAREQRGLSALSV